MSKRPGECADWAVAGAGVQLNDYARNLFHVDEKMIGPITAMLKHRKTVWTEATRHEMGGREHVHVPLGLTLDVPGS